MKIAKIAGVDVHIEYSLPVYLAASAIGMYFAHAVGSIQPFLAAMGIIYISVLLHEFGHVLVARHFGVETRVVRMHFYGAFALLEKIPEKPIEEFLMAAAGPLVNCGIALLAWVLQLILHESGFSTLVGQVVYYNLLLAAFNLMPIFPMDGGRVFRALLAMKLTRLRATFTAARVGQVGAVLMATGGAWAFKNVFLVIVGVLIFIMAQAEWHYVEHEETRKEYAKLFDNYKG